MNQIVIINFDRSDMIGSHWVLCVCREKKYVVYFDSFGVQPPESILKFLRGYVKKHIVKDVVMTDKQVQTLKDGYCGLAILKYLKEYILNHKEAYEAINLLSKKSIISYGKLLFRLYH